jgi:hypothetical protein
MDQQAIKRWKTIARDALSLSRAIGGYTVGSPMTVDSWRALLDMHCATNGRATEMVQWAMQAIRPAKARIDPFKSLLGSFSGPDVRKIADQIRKEGYFIFENRLPSDVCDRISAEALRLEARAGRKSDSKMAVFDPQNPKAHVYDIPEVSAIEIADLQRIVADPIFVNVAQSYFRAQPNVMSTLLWWSPVMGGEADTDAAQLFHFDFDPAPIWLKFFIYLTDVTPETGPHVFVRGSHRRGLPASQDLIARHYVRIPDRDIESAYGQANIVELVGKRGTVVAVDTLGFHKGKPPLASHRLLAQIVVSSPLFVELNAGQKIIPKNLTPEFSGALRSRPWAFPRYVA